MFEEKSIEALQDGLSVQKLRKCNITNTFSEELVETEAEIARREGRGYETAEVLIERIKEEKGSKEKKQ